MRLCPARESLSIRYRSAWLQAVLKFMMLFVLILRNFPKTDLLKCRRSDKLDWMYQGGMVAKAEANKRVEEQQQQQQQQQASQPVLAAEPGGPDSVRPMRAIDFFSSLIGGSHPACQGLLCKLCLIALPEGLGAMYPHAGAVYPHAVPC